MIRNLQTSRDIREHLNELNRGLGNSKNKPLLNEFIYFWRMRYIVQKNKELILNK